VTAPAAIAQPDLAPRLAAAVAAARLAALSALPTAIAAIDLILKQFNAKSAAAAAAVPTPPSTAAPSAPAPAPQPLSFEERALAHRERRLAYSAAYFILRVSRLPDDAPHRRPLSSPAPAQPHRRPAPQAPRPLAPLGFAPAAESRLADSRASPPAPSPSSSPSALPHPTSNVPHSTSAIPLIPLAQRVYNVLSEGIPADEAAGLRESLIDATEDDVRAMVDSIRNVYGDDYIPELNDIVPAAQRNPPPLPGLPDPPDLPDPLNPNRAPRSGNPRASPASLLAAAGSSGPAP
jgi:hypothetical protein